MVDYDGGTASSQFGTDDGEPDYTSPVGQVRLLTADLDLAAPMLSDALYTGYLLLQGGNVNRAAADVLDAMATSEVLLGKKLRTQDLATDGPAVAAELRKQAATLRAKADAIDAVADAGYFEIIPSGPYSTAEAAERGTW